MQSPLQIKDFIDFEELFKELSTDIYRQKAKEKLTNDDLVKAF